MSLFSISFRTDGPDFCFQLVTSRISVIWWFVRYSRCANFVWDLFDTISASTVSHDTCCFCDSSVIVCFCSAVAAASSRRCAFLTLHSLHLRSEDIVRWRFYVFGIWQFRRREYERVWGNDLWNHRSAKHPFQELDPPPPPSPPVSIRFLFLAPLLKCPIVSC